MYEEATKEAKSKKKTTREEEDEEGVKYTEYKDVKTPGGTMSAAGRATIHEKRVPARSKKGTCPNVWGRFFGI